jgi:hypothetical protein
MAASKALAVTSEHSLGIGSVRRRRDETSAAAYK